MFKKKRKQREKYKENRYGSNGWSSSTMFLVDWSLGKENMLTPPFAPKWESDKRRNKVIIWDELLEREKKNYKKTGKRENKKKDRKRTKHREYVPRIIIQNE